MRWSRIASIPLFLLVFVAACEASCEFSTAKLTDVRMARSVDPETQAPVEVTDSFSLEDPLVYVTTRLAHAIEDTRVAASFHYLEDEPLEIARDEIVAPGSMRLSFSLSRPDTGWPPGRYEARLYLEGEEVEKVPFTVGSSGAERDTAATDTAATGPDPEDPARVGEASGGDQPNGETTAVSSREPSRAPGTRLWRDEEFEIELELPADWRYRVLQDGSYIFEGQPGTEAFEASIILQFVAKSFHPGGTVEGQMEEFIAQIREAPEGRVVERNTIVSAGQRAPYSVASYRSVDSRERSMKFEHLQVILDHGSHFYWLGYRAPEGIYEAHAPVFSHLVANLRFTGS